jgi:hypothetical protein
MNDDLLIALAGGAVGSLATGVIAVFTRAVGAWSDVKDHDIQAAHVNGALEWWVADRTRVLAGERAMITTDMNERGLLHSGAFDTALSGARTRALREYRDERQRVQAELARLRAAEGTWHAIWRLSHRRRHGLALTADTRVQPFLERWRAPFPSSMSGTAQVEPDDPSRRTLDDELRDLPAIQA